MKFARILAMILKISSATKIKMLKNVLEDGELGKYLRYFNYKIKPTEFFLKGLAMRNFRQGIKAKQIDQIVKEVRSNGKNRKTLGKRRVKR